MSLTTQQREWVLSASAQRVISVLMPATPEFGAVFWASESWAAEFFGTMIFFEAQIIRPWTLRRVIRNDLIGGGQPEVGYGDLTIGDAQVSSGWIGRRVVIIWGDPAWSIGDHITIMDGVLKSIRRSGFDTVIELASASDQQDELLHEDHFDESDAPSNPGALKPFAQGRVFNAEAVPLDLTLTFPTFAAFTKEIGQAVFPITSSHLVAVRDNGIALTFNSDWFTNNSPGFGHLPDGVFALDNLIGRITFDVDGPFQDIRNTILRCNQVVFGDGFGMDLTAFPTLQSGYFVSGEPQSIFEVTHDLANSLGGAVFPLRDASFKGVQIRVPAGEPIERFSEREISGGATIDVASRRQGKVSLIIKRNWAQQDPDSLAAGVSAEDRYVNFTLEGATVTAGDGSPQFGPIQTLLTNRDQAQGEAQRWLNIVGTERSMHAFESLIGAGLVELGDEIRVSHKDVEELAELKDERGEVIMDENFHPLEEGKDMIVTGMEETFPYGSVHLTGWV